MPKEKSPATTSQTKINATSKNSPEGKPSPPKDPFIYSLLITFNCLAGLGLSLYAYTVEMKLELDRSYKPYCDVAPQVSCTKAFGSEYGKGMGIFGKEWELLHHPNSLFGIIYYSMLGTLAKSNLKISVNISFVMVIASNFASLYFAYILYFVLYNICLVCIAIYIVNITNMVLLHRKWRILQEIWKQCECDQDKARQHNKKKC